MEITVYCIRSFTKNNLGGNPAGVVLAADKLNSQQMQSIAQQVDYSETAFVSADDHCDFNVRFFTPTDEVDFCGHATLAAFSLLFEKGLIENRRYTQQTKAGELGVTVSVDKIVTMEQALPKFLGTIASNDAADLLQIEPEHFKSTCLPCEIVSTGLADILIPVPFGTLDNIKPDLDKISDFSKKYKAVGLHVFEIPIEPSNITANCRNFAPLFGIPEESATGSACGALACYLAKHDVICSRKYTFEQGRNMDSPSMLYAQVAEHKVGSESEIESVTVSGTAYCFDKIGIDLNVIEQSGITLQHL